MSDITRVIVFDVETTGRGSPKYVEIVQLSYILYNTKTQTIEYRTIQPHDIVKINATSIPEDTTNIHGIVIENTYNKRPIKEHIDEFIDVFNQADMYVGQNIGFDIRMIRGQIAKYYHTLQGDEKEKYDVFLSRFLEPLLKTPKKNDTKARSNSAYCTMRNSKDICDVISGERIASRQLKEIHKILFKQSIEGQLHNALVDVAVTLRVFLKLTRDIDICQTFSKTDSVVNVENNNDICNLINPQDIDYSKPVGDNEEELDEYSDELITGITFLPNGETKEETIIVESIYKDIATKLVNNAEEMAMKSIVSKSASVAPIDKVLCTEIRVCTTKMVRGERKGKECGKKIGYCHHYSRPKIISSVKKTMNTAELETSVKSQESTKTDLSSQINSNSKVTPYMSADIPNELDEPINNSVKKKPISAKDYAKNLLNNMHKVTTSRSNKQVIPLNEEISGGKRKTRKQRKNKKTYKKRINKKILTLRRISLAMII